MDRSDTLAPDALRAKLDQVPALAGPREVSVLAGGLTNVNLKVTTPRGAFVCRCFHGDASLLGIDRDAEHLNSRAAAEAGVGAGVVDYRPDLGMLVIEFLPGSTLTNADFGRPGVLERAATSMRRLHAGPRFVNEFDMFARQHAYRELVSERGFPLPRGYDDHAGAFARVQRALAERPEPTVPCNNDLLAGNFVDDGERVWLIDYEYSGNNDACFELGNTSTECDLDDGQTEALVAAYFGRLRRSRLARTRLQAMVSQYGWSLWGFIQAASSSLDFDFTAWGTERFEKAARGFTGRDLPLLLEEVHGDD